MKTILKDGRRYILRFDKDEELFDALAKFAEAESIGAASFSGIGTTSLVELAYFNQHLKEYRHKPIMEDLEIVSLNGNISMLDGKPSVHAHGTFSRTDFTVVGGHIFKLITLATCEIFLIKLEGQAIRKQNDTWGLKLLE
jgi:predicted DNA-binding protein with PD1-like motif